MSDERRVMALLEEGNPAPELGDDAWTDLDAAAYLATLEQRISEMTRLETNESREDSSRRSNMRWLVAAMVVLVLGIAVVVFNQMRPLPIAGVPEIPLEGAEEHPGAAEAFSAVEAAYAAFNAGDPAWIEIRMMGSYFSDPADLEESIAQMEEGWPGYMAAEPRVEVSGCYSRGLGEWPTLVDAGVPTPTGYYFVCSTTETDSLLDIAGVSGSQTYTWVVDDSGVVAVMESGGITDADVVFFSAFEEWLDSTHPEAAAELAALRDEWGYGFGDLGTRTRIINYAEEFVAQSDVYPMEGSNS